MNFRIDTIICSDASDAMNSLRKVKGVKYCVVTDPPYNIGYHYKDYEDNMEENDYLKMIKDVVWSAPFVLIHYPETLHKISIACGIVPERIISWVYNSNTPRQHRDIAFYGVKPDFSKVSQPYKNQNDRRIQERIKQGKMCRMYDWFEQNQIKNVEKEKMNIEHPCVIPLEVMDKIVKMIPEEYVIVDPFCGSGTTCIAAKKNGRHFIGIERNETYARLAQRRLNEETCQLSLF